MVASLLIVSGCGLWAGVVGYSSLGFFGAMSGSGSRSPRCVCVCVCCGGGGNERGVSGVMAGTPL